MRSLARRLRAGLLPVALLAGFAFADNVPAPAPPKIPAKGYILMDHASGDVLAESNADARLEPASLTKLMTAYIAFDALGRGDIGLDDAVTVSERAWRTPGSRMFIEVDTQVSVEKLLHGLIVQSGNDASVALAEHIAGSVESFVELMNRRASELGMTGTAYANPTGLPAEGHVSTARDLAVLARALIDRFPEYYDWYSIRDYTYNEIKQHNRNALLWRDDSVDGLKTGYTDSAGYCQVSSAERSGMRLIAVVLGMPSAQSRADGSEALLDYGFAHFETHRLYARGQQLTEVRVWKGNPAFTGLAIDRDLYVTIPRGAYDLLSATMQLTTELIAPVDQDTLVGRVEVSLAGERLATASLTPSRTVPVAGLLTRMIDGFRLWLE